MKKYVEMMIAESEGDYTRLFSIQETMTDEEWEEYFSLILSED